MALYTKYAPASFESYEDFTRNYKLDIPDNFNFAYDIVDEYARIEPNKRAMVWCNPAGEERVFNFREMKEYSDKVARYFQDLGIRKGDNVMLILKRYYEFWFCITALHKLGAIAIPATNQLMAKDIVYRCDIAEVKMIVCAPDKQIVEHVEAACDKCKTLKYKILAGATRRDGWDSLDEGMANAGGFTRPTGEEATCNDDIMLAYFTSGTTGMPKLVEHTFLYPLGHIHTGAFWHCVHEDTIHLTVSDTGWGKAVWGKLYGQWLAGAAVLVYDYDRFVPGDLLSIMAKYRITTFCAPPTIYRFLVQEDITKYDLSSIEYYTTAGEALNPEVFNKWKKITGLEIREGFGQTETTLVLATFPWVDICPGSMGKPAPIFDVTLLDDDGNICAPGEIGEISISTANGRPVGMFAGYRGAPELNEKVCHDGFYHTGDTAWRDEAGYFWYVGRADDVIKSSGYRIGPFEVESALMEHPAVLECAITGAPDPIRGTVVKATIVLVKNKGYEPTNELVRELQNHVKKTTAPYKYPRVVEFVDELPKTISGKIRRVELRENSEKK
ncbi:MAG: AMP-binding protein [Clostridia bacterium]